MMAGRKVVEPETMSPMSQSCLRLTFCIKVCCEFLFLSFVFFCCCCFCQFNSAFDSCFSISRTWSNKSAEEKGAKREGLALWTQTFGFRRQVQYLEVMVLSANFSIFFHLKDFFLYDTHLHRSLGISGIFMNITNLSAMTLIYPIL